MEEKKVKVKAYCPKCFMTFETSKKSKRVYQHLAIGRCDELPCPKQGSNCIRKFATVNSANRHTYCYTQEEVNSWDASLCIEATDQIPDFSNLRLIDEEEEDKALSPANTYKEGPPFKYSDVMTLEEMFAVVKRKLGSEFPQEKLDMLKRDFAEKGFTNLGILRIAKANYGNWEFLCKEFQRIGRSIEGVSHAIKHIAIKPRKNNH